MQKQAYIFIGRYGSGKGTQARLLIEAIKSKDSTHPIIDIETGLEFRKFIEGADFTAKHTKRIVDSGGLMPDFMPVYLWARALISRYTGVESIVFDGTPRKLNEARSLESLFPFYELGKPWVIYLDVDHDESHKRLSIRAKEGRKDDLPEAIEKRRLAYESEVLPTIEWYRTNPNVNFLDIDGERPIEQVHADIVKSLGL